MTTTRRRDGKQQVSGEILDILLSFYLLGGDDELKLIDCKRLPQHTGLNLVDVLAAEYHPELKVQSEMEVGDDKPEGWGVWDDEIEDMKVKYMIGLIETGHTFKKSDWGGGDAKEVLYNHVEYLRSQEAAKKRKRGVENGKRIIGGQPVMKQKRLSTYFKKPRLEDDDRIKELTDRVERLEKLVEILTKKIRRRKRSGFTPRKDDDDSRRAEGFIGGSPAFDVGEGSAPDLVVEDLGAQARSVKDESSRDEVPMDDMPIEVEPMDEKYLEAEAEESESAGAVETRSANQGDDGLGTEPGDVDEADVEGESKDSESSGAVDSTSPPNEDAVEEENAVEEEVDGSGLSEPEDEDSVVEEADSCEFSEEEEEAECSESSDRVDDDAVEEEGDCSESSGLSDVVMPLKEGDGVPRQWVGEGMKGYRGATLYRATTSNSFYVTDEEVRENISFVFDAELGANERVTCLSDSSSCERSEKHKLEESEGNLAALLLAKAPFKLTEIVPAMEDPDFVFFEQVLMSNPKVLHLGAGKYDLDNEFFLDLATPQKWVSSKHIEVLVDFISQRHHDLLAERRAMFVAPWFMDRLASKARAFNAATYKDRSLRPFDAVIRIMGPIGKMLPYLVRKLAATEVEESEIEDLTDELVDYFRKRFAIDVYKEWIVPLYMGAMN
ncbi:unnamed protein product [Eruca vesicaria subsp. sativa]|uniref:Uncharacterized protein n=1 Tax=Eruca vesicaria subsp. sativa TaxID=29727 RepID=A0ABC8KTH3_ERUVS|nr:unnamed protein product [Eruca vesicaria subsp. sativa]